MGSVSWKTQASGEVLEWERGPWSLDGQAVAPAMGRKAGADSVPWFFRDTMLQALRFVIQGAGGKVDAAIRKSIVSLLLSMLGHDEVQWQMEGWMGVFLGSPLPLIGISALLQELDVAASHS